MENDQSADSASARRALLASPGLAAIDLDGTLLGPDQTISRENRRAISRLREAGFEVVIATGRHRESARPFAASLPEVRWMVSTQGSEVSDVARTERLSRDFLAPALLDRVLTARPAWHTPALFYAAEGILTDTEDCEELRFYQKLAGVTVARAALGEIREAKLFKMVWVMPDDDIAALIDSPLVRSLNIQTVRSHERLIEFMPVGVNKGTGLATLARHLGSTASQAVVFGDAENDIPMFEWAARSYAMPHAWETAKRRASHVVSDGPRETAVARAVDHLLG